MKDGIECAREYRRANPGANIRQAREYARSLDGDEAFVGAFVREWYLEAFRAGVKKQQFSNDVERIWPEDKYG